MTESAPDSPAAEPIATCAAPTPLQLLRHALLFGGIGGALAGGWAILLHALKWQHQVLGVVSLVIPVVTVMFGLIRWRNTACGGSFKFTRAFGPALAIGFVFTLVVASSAWVQAAFIDPTMMETLFNQQLAFLRSSGKTEAEITQWSERMAALRTPGGLALSVLSQTLVYMLLVCLAGSVTVPKQSATRVA